MLEDNNVLKIEENKHSMLCYLAMRGQLRNQIELFDALWNELLEQPMQYSWFRLLRINLRKLRSAIKILEPLLPFESKEWLAFLKSTADDLGSVREYDVALKECDKYTTYQLEQQIPNFDKCQNLFGLKQLLENKRKELTDAWLETAKSGCIANELSDLLTLIKNDEKLSVEEEALANAFLQARLQSWGIKLCNRLQNEFEQDSIEKLHALRIKVKRFRYAYDVYMNQDADDELLACLKNAQDILGSIHDGECDISIIESLVTETGDLQLIKELECFKKWRLEKTKQRFESLPKARTELIAALQCNISGARLI